MSADGQPTATRPPRQYDSTLRRRQARGTRQAVLDAATALFSERGWTVGMREIAAAAGVSVETVYANFGSKAQLLDEVLDVAVVGDDEPVALMERAEFAALGQGNQGQRAAAAARLASAINGRTAGLQRALREAAAVEPDLATRLEAARARQRVTVHAAVSMLTGREADATAAEGLSAVVSDEVYELLTGSAGWSPAKYEEWLTGVLVRLFDLQQ
jgi:AcrR family transcriptional regulator